MVTAARLGCARSSARSENPIRPAILPSSPTALASSMPRRVFKPLSRQRHRWKARWFMRPFRLLLEHPAYWSLNRRSVTRAFALGLFIAFVPLPIHVILSAVLALVLRLNVPAAIVGTFIANPLTLVPMYWAAYRLGADLLDTPVRKVAFAMNWEWLTTTLVPIW